MKINIREYFSKRRFMFLFILKIVEEDEKINRLSGEELEN